MRSPTRTLIASFGLVTALVAPSLATVPGGIDITCDVPRTGPTSFRGAAVGQTDVKFKLWSAATGGTQLGSDYTVPMGNLAVAKRYTDKYDSVKPRKAMRINAVIGSDGSPVLLPVDGQAWLEVTVGTTTLGCDFAATADPTADPTARRRLQSVAFSRESNHSETCETCTSTADVSARVFRSTNFAVPNTGSHPVPFDQERWDTDAIHDSSSADCTDGAGGQGCRLTAKTDGKYLIFASIMWDRESTGSRGFFINLNGPGRRNIADATQPAVAETFTTQVISTHWQMNAGDFVELWVSQSSAVNPLNLLVSDPRSIEFGIVKLP